ncbi:unnamed protein product [Allacma fusca]|uniref:Uncharacterized protein n=1 Tax=Allacma fusca TaxID=39272 RepID=A0A8J2P2L7_9HEXA|nr:unnamed protein product [Allacma fusca]
MKKIILKNDCYINETDFQFDDIIMYRNIPTCGKEITMFQMIFEIVFFICFAICFLTLVVLIWKMLANWNKFWNSKDPALHSMSVYIQVEEGRNHHGGENFDQLPAQQALCWTDIVNESKINSSTTDLSCGRLYSYGLN